MNNNKSIICVFVEVILRLGLTRQSTEQDTRVDMSMSIYSKMKIINEDYIVF